MIPDKKAMIGHKGSPVTQSLFLEIGYDTRYAVYSTRDSDWEYKGKIYPSLKRLYLEEEDVTEYDFANKYFISWNHWQRICRNNLILPVVQEMREELELKLRARAVKAILNGEKTFQATKWIADKGWGAKVVGRPTKKATEREKNMQHRLGTEFKEDIKRMNDLH